MCEYCEGEKRKFIKGPQTHKRGAWTQFGIENFGPDGEMLVSYPCYYHYTFNTDREAIIINYCPMCGRQLRATKKSNDCDVPVEALELGTRAINCLKRAGMNNLHDVLLLKPQSRRSLHRCGVITWEEIISAVNKAGYYFNWQ